MGKVVVKEKKGQTRIINKLLRAETVNELACQSISAGRFEGLLPVFIERKGKKTSIVCSVKGMITLDQWNRLVTKRMFLDLVMSVISVIRNCENNAMNPNNLDLKSDRLFLDPVSQKFWAVYWPVANNQNSCLPQHFFEKLPVQLNFALHEEMSFMDEYVSFFKADDPFSLNSFENLILRLQGKTKKKGLIVPSEDHSDVSMDRFEKEDPEKIVDVEYNPFDTVTTESMGFFTHVPNQQLAPDDNIDAIRLPVLVRSDNNEFFAVNKPIFRVGSSVDCSDLTIKSRYISKHHADIISKNRRYFIVDRGSTNKTLLNGHIIPNNQEIEIASGSKIRFADVDFVFWIPEV